VTQSLVVDANPVLSALLGGTARDVLFSDRVDCFATQYTLFEVAKYLPMVSQRLHQAETDLFRAFQLMPIAACQPNIYDSHLQQATALIAARDPKDVHVLALSLRLGLPIWTEDHDFEGLEGVVVLTTADLVGMLAKDT
jgi:predicted nucleic acid-binding protein